MKQRLKQQKIKRNNESGFTGVDIAIAIGIVTLFTGIIATISYNIYLASTSVKMISKANSYIVDIFEQVDILYYDEVTAQSLVSYFNNKPDVGSEAKASITGFGGGTSHTFRIEIQTQTYITTDYNLPKLDLIKKVIVTVTYKVGNKEQVLTMTKLKAREALTTPNSPDMETVKSAPTPKVNDITRIKPIKYINGVWQVCSTTDSSWYNYDNGVWATVLIVSPYYTGDPIEEGGVILAEDIEDVGDLWIWIPRYSYKILNPTKTEAVFEYGLSGRYVKSEKDGLGNVYQRLEDIDVTFGSDFTNNINIQDKTGTWVKKDTNLVNSNLYRYLNYSIYKSKIQY